MAMIPLLDYDDDEQEFIIINILYDYLTSSHEILTYDEVMKVREYKSLLEDDSISTEEKEKYNEYLDEVSDKLSIDDIIIENDNDDIYRCSINGTDEEYLVAEESDMDYYCKSYIKDYFEGENYSLLGLDHDIIKRVFLSDEYAKDQKEELEESLNDNPENYLNDNQRSLSKKQLAEISILVLNDHIDAISEYMVNTGTNYEKKILEYETKIEEFEASIESIEDDPNGDFPQEVIDEKLDELVNDVKKQGLSHFIDRYPKVIEKSYYNPKQTITFDENLITQYIDYDELASLIFNYDGYLLISRYDGEWDDQSYNGKNYIIIRQN